MPKPDEPYRSEEEVEGVVRGFESCELPPADFKHREHLIVALSYLTRESDAEALARVRANIAKYAAAHGVNPGLYHETVTVFWLRRVRAYVGRGGAGRGPVERANEVSRECGPSRLVLDYYSKELIDSEEARRGWVEPDLKPLDF